jgi:enterochelin esterase family protein
MRIIGHWLVFQWAVIKTQNITTKDPGMFNYIGVMGMGVFSSFRNADTGYNKEKHVAELKALMASKPKLYWIGMGKSDFLYGTGYNS